jgi:flavin-dependent dehydrogenase
MAQWSRRVTADGACLVGDAADFFDPFTGQGIYSALRTGELAAETLGRALARGGPVRRAALAPYARARRAEFRGKWLLERLICGGVGWPRLVERVVPALARRPDLADLLVGATGNFVPARAVLTPRVLASLLR